jgi:hypothetical protein
MSLADIQAEEVTGSLNLQLIHLTIHQAEDRHKQMHRI